MKPPRALVRLTLVVTYFAYLAIQVSGRYYQCASVPYYFSHIGQTSSGHALKNQSLGPNSFQVLSLDKRYDGKHVYALPSAFIAPANRPDAAVTLRTEHPSSLPVPLPRVPGERGPPFHT